MRPSYRPHYAFCPSVCPSVRPSVCPSFCLSLCLSICPVWADHSKTKKTYKNENWHRRSPGTSKWNANFRLKMSKVKDVRKHRKLASCYLYGRPIISAWRVRRRLQTRPMPLLGLIYCRRLRRSAAGRMDGHIISSALGGDISACPHHQGATCMVTYM